MSASLVGSEMCIRDRGAPPHQWTAAPGSCRASAPLEGAGRNSDGPPSTCLLYTSDAADDM
eukprot:5024489-Alexandrium_andersonii.AAC.1